MYAVLQTAQNTVNGNKSIIDEEKPPLTTPSYFNYWNCCQYSDVLPSSTPGQVKKRYSDQCQKGNLIRTIVLGMAFFDVLFSAILISGPLIFQVRLVSFSKLQKLTRQQDDFEDTHQKNNSITLLSASSAIRVPWCPQIASVVAWGLAVSVYYSAHRDNKYQAHGVFITTIFSCLCNWLLFRDTRKVAMVGFPCGVSAGLIGAAIVHIIVKWGKKETVEGCKTQTQSVHNDAKGEEEIQPRTLMGKYS